MPLVMIVPGRLDLWVVGTGRRWPTLVTRRRLANSNDSTVSSNSSDCDETDSATGISDGEASDRRASTDSSACSAQLSKKPEVRNLSQDGRRQQGTG